MLRVADGWLEVDGKEVPLLAGEFHYWRNERGCWPEILDRIADAGFTTVTSFVQWNVHEYEPGKFDFTGERAPQRDIPALLKLAQERGLYVHLRPGPACCEWRVSGATSFGTPWMQCFDEFWKVVEPYQVTNGGPLLLLQIHNEWFGPIGFYNQLRHSYIGEFDGFHTPPVPYWLELCVMHPHYVGAGEDFDWQYLSDYLRHAYPSVDQLNAAWETSYTEFDQAVEDMESKSGNTFAGLVDYMTSESKGERFAKGNLAELFDLLTWCKLYMAFPLRKYIDQVRERASTLITHNWPTVTEKMYNEVAGLDLSGYDHYQRTSANPWDWVLLTSEFQNNKLPFSGEFMCGTIAPYMWGGQGMYDPGFARFSILSFFATGLKAINLYMLVERDNWSQCPVDRHGKTRPSYEAVRGIIRGLRAVEWHKAERQYDLFILRHSPYQHCGSPSPHLFPRSSFALEWLRDGPYAGIDVQADFYDLSKALHEASIDFSSADTGDGDRPDLRGRKTISALSLPFMQREFAEKLVEVAKSGGEVLIYPCIPVRDEFGKPMDALREALQAQVADTIQTQEIVIDAPAGSSTVASPEPRKMQVFRVDGEYIPCATADGKLCGFRKKTGEGEIVVLGFQPSEFPESVGAVYADLLGCRRYASTATPLSDASVAVNPSGEAAVIVYNGNAEEALGGVRLDASLGEQSRDYSVWDLLQNRSLGTVRWDSDEVEIAAPVPPRDAVMLRLTPTRDEKPKPRVREYSQIRPPAWRMRVVGVEETIRPYLAGADSLGWVEVHGKDWTLPAIASGGTLGVQGWFWLRQTVELPHAAGPVYVCIRPRGWHNIHVVHFNGREVGRMLVDRPGGEAQFDVTEFAQSGPNEIAVRTYRQSLDCHDMGACGFERFTVRHGGGESTIDRWSLAQERLDFTPAREPDAAEDTAGLPVKLALRKDGAAAWLFGRLDLDGEPEDTRVILSGDNASVTVFANGEYAGESPYLPVELPLGKALKISKNAIALRIAADILAEHTIPRDERYAFWIQEASDALHVRLDEVVFAVRL